MGLGSYIPPVRERRGSNVEDNGFEPEENNSPTDITLSSQSIDENIPLGTVVGILETSDPDVNDNHTYSLVNQSNYPDNDGFIIDADSLKTNDLIDYESQISYSIFIRTTDNGAGELFYEEEFIISVNDLDDTGIKNLQTIEQLKIYPNPFSNNTIIEFDNPNHEKYDLIIRDLAGKVVETMYCITNERIEITADKFSEGCYIIELRGGKLYRGKLMVE